MGSLSPVQLILMILGVEVLSAPIIFSLLSLLIDRWYEAKYKGLSGLINSYIKVYADGMREAMKTNSDKKEDDKEC